MVKLQEIRKSKGIKATQAAAKLGITRNALWNYENGKRTPSFHMMIKIAKLYGVSIADFVDESKDVETAAENIGEIAEDIDLGDLQMEDLRIDLSALDSVKVVE